MPPPLLSLFKYCRQKISAAFYPPHCLLCQEDVVHDDTFCPHCFNHLNFIHAPYCMDCGYPLEGVSNPIQCASCLARPLSFSLRSSLVYNETSKQLILGLKYGDRLDLKKALGNILYQGGKDFLHTIDMIVPVPLHWRRLWWRRYNQATLLSHGLNQALIAYGKRPIPIVPTKIVRLRHTSPQGHASRQQRHLNVRGAFAIKEKGFFKRKNILLIDDVYTTGATLKACAKVIKKDGANAVYALTLARLVRGTDIS